MSRQPKRRNKVIKPTVGRVVLYWPRNFEGGMKISDDQPMAATVAYVWNDRLVNLSVKDHRGNVHGLLSVKLIQPEDDRLEGGGFCEWMEFQKGQAGKTEALEKKVEGLSPEPESQ